MTGLTSHYNINDHVEVYGEFSYMHNSTNELGTPNGFNYGQNFTTPCNYPFLTSGELAGFCGGATTGNFQTLIGYGATELGPRVSSLVHDSYRGVGGVRGAIDDNWKYDVSFQYGATDATNDTSATASVNHAANILSNCTINPNDGCVPYNFLQNDGATNSAAAQAYLQVPYHVFGGTREAVLTGTLSGNLARYGIKSPWASDAVDVVVGGEYRKESLFTGANPEVISGDANYGAPYLPTNGSFHVGEFFTEARVPVASKQPLAENVDLDLAYRFSDYSLAGTTNTYALQANYTPVDDDFRLRGSYQRAVRAPNVIELFTPETIATYQSYTDPCSGTMPTLSLARCQLTGLTAAQYGTALSQNVTPNNNNVQVGGNAALKPEVASTFSVGAVFQPAVIPGLRLTADYYNILVEDVIQQGAAPGGQIISNCAETGSSYFCNLIHRDATGSVGLTNNGYVQGQYVNAGSLQTSGIDFTGSYNVSLQSYGGLVFAFNGTDLETLKSQPIKGGSKYDCAGFYGQTCGTPSPKWRSKLRVTWNTPFQDLSLSVQWQYFAAANVDTSSTNPVLSGPTWPVDSRQQAISYFDLSGSLPLNDNLVFRMGVNNIFDQDPPYYSLGDGNTFPQFYNPLGRYIFAGLNLKI
jgi:outer membrane receptor protein involved in Fe transport